MAKKILFTSESVSEGHPDKLCDQIADAILDACLEGDKNSRVAVEVLATVEKVVIAGEVTTKSKVDYEKIARQVMEDVGYISPEMGIGASSAKIEVLVKNQSNDIAQGVDSSFDSNSLGAGDQGMMFGYASSETENLMPLPIVMAHKIVRTGALLRKNGTLKHARPDMKAQVTIDYTDEKNPRVDTIVCSCQHDEEVDIEDFRKELLEVVIKPVVSSFNMNLDFKYYINPTGRFVIGGPLGDTGVTGRKIIVDTYGGSCPHGGGAFSGKDPSKVDRSAAYAARHCAKNIVGASLASRCQVQVSYAIGVSAPVSIAIETFGTETVEKSKILEAVEALFDFTPKGIIERFSLTNPTFKYRELTNYGHFGRPDLDLPFEKLDMVDRLKEYIEKIK
ncbi:MAG: methionine adenosyltransferase [Bacilli bacterium]|nr:methionine adenosyltransferase [Bacilli bacterium]MDD7375114.1 methionine adenosyltransferase [Bacilli bacterium]MDD7598118.1 methionine adenosyltransferase [Bacilli bacterium]MDY5655312.1 methionine adenosyltransferase [Bacilli bacterium]MDY5899174.1 methionine adenosyltransferase [Bacilli bacterium]